MKAAGHELAAALVKGDSTILERLIADDFRYIHSTGKLETKRLFLDGIAAGKIQYEWMKLSDLVTDEVTADVVVLSGKIDQRKFSSGRWGEIVLLFHSVWRKETDDWRLVSLQTVFPPPPAPKP